MKKKGRAYLLVVLIGIGLAFSVPVMVHADANPVQRRSQKNSAKTYMKQQKKQQKKEQKLQNKAVKNWKKRHQAGHRAT